MLTDFTKLMGNTARTKLLETLYDNRNEVMTKEQLAKLCGVGYTSTWNVFQYFVEMGVVLESDDNVDKRKKLYQWNEQNKIAKALAIMLEELG